MEPDQSEHEYRWNENLSLEFIDYGRYFVPYREEQIEIMVSLLPLADVPRRIIELCCGEGLLGEAILNANQNVYVIGFDGSREMLNHAEKRLARFGRRFKPIEFDLADKGWRVNDQPIHGVVSSLAIHHLHANEKGDLFEDIYRMLVPGGVFIIADIIDPVHLQSKALAATMYDQVVKKQVMAIDGNTKAYELFNREGWNIFHYLDPKDIDKPSPILDQLEWLVDAGFEKVDVFWLYAGHAVFGGWKPEC